MCTWPQEAQQASGSAALETEMPRRGCQRVPFQWLFFQGLDLAAKTISAAGCMIAGVEVPVPAAAVMVLGVVAGTGHIAGAVPAC
jgi:hypothetical protein